MYVPKHFEQPNVEVMHALMNANPLATLVTVGSEGLCADHIPMAVLEKPEPYGMLVGHVARANPVWHGAAGKSEVLVIFHGPNAYISPSWYPSKNESGKVVPTWNYAVVHAYGRIRFIDDPLWVKAHITNLTSRHEAIFPHPWAVSDAPDEFIEKLIGVVVGIEMEITKLVGKWKVSQNRPQDDRSGVASGLRGLGTSTALQMAECMENTNP